MDAWYADDIRGAPTVSRDLWVQLSRYDQDLYRDFAVAALRHAAKDDKKFYTFTRALFPDGFFTRELPHIPVLRGIHKSGFFVECDLRFTVDCKSADGHVIAPRDLQDWRVDFVPNGAYDPSVTDPL
jgi:hypothetical protein